MKYVFVEDYITAKATEDFKVFNSLPEATKYADNVIAHKTKAEIQEADELIIMECDMTDAEVEAIENCESEYWYGDYCIEIVKDYKN